MHRLDTNHDQFVNVAVYLKQNALKRAGNTAVANPCGRKNGRVHYDLLTFDQLDRKSDALAHGLEKTGIQRGTHTILMLRPSLEFFICIFALFKIGAVPVVVDPGMGLKRMLNCFKESRPEAFIGIPPAHALRILRPFFFKTVNACVTVGKRWFWGGQTLEQIMHYEHGPYPIAQTQADETAAILFTTGSTGPAKGVVYTHGNFDAQLQQIGSHLDLSTDDVDLSTFPLFALFWPALGLTSVIPDMDPTRPARVNPKKIIEAIMERNVTQMFASPALLNRVGTYGRQKGIKLPTLRRVISAGAPVSAAVIECFAGMLTDGAEIHTPYGATEAVPIVSIRSNEILSETRQLSDQGFGTCIGYPINNIPVQLIRITDDPIENWHPSLAVPDNEVGEITVKGALVTRQYYHRPRDTALAKIKDGDSFWHRMGDLGRRDEKGRIWFYGRKSHRVITTNGPMYTIPCEAIFNTHPHVYRSALVGIGIPGEQKPIICIELTGTGKSANPRQIEKELLESARKHEMTRLIDTILFHRSFPVDIRHNSKIFREQLTLWAEKQIR